MCPKEGFKTKVKFSLVVTFIVLGMLAIGGVNAFAQDSTGVEKVKTEQQANGSQVGLGLLAAALAFGFGALGAGIAIANVGSAAMGAIAEKPEIATQALIFIALAEGLVVFGFVTALMIIGRI
ncbi:MAG: ATP synthase subunit C [Spirochaetaceae bacterium]|nr:ATP synthase subunit C [Spirochaetaceae bacterium]